VWELSKQASLKETKNGIMIVNLRKTLIFVLLLSLVACSREMYKSRVNKVYKPLSVFKADTAKMQLGADTADYIKYNFIQNKHNYIGKKFKYLAKDLKLDFFEVRISDEYYDRAHIHSLTFYFFDRYWVRKGVYYDLIILFQDKLSVGEYELLENNNNTWNFTWNKSKYNFFKNRIIKDIIMSDSRAWKNNEIKK
jgi:hypothetical protein